MHPPWGRISPPPGNKSKGNMTQAPAQSKTYYSTAANLTCWAGKPQVVIENGHRAVQEAPMIQFHPFVSAGQGISDSYGMFVTDDPAIQAYLDARIAEAKARGATCDILDAESFNNAMQPMEVKIKSMESTINDLMRKIESNNALIETLKKQEAKQGR